MFRDFLNFMNANIEFYQNEEPVLKRPRREIVSCFDTPGLYEVSSQVNIVFPYPSLVKMLFTFQYCNGEKMSMRQKTN